MEPRAAGLLRLRDQPIGPRLVAVPRNQHPLYLPSPVFQGRWVSPPSCHPLHPVPAPRVPQPRRRALGQGAGIPPQSAAAWRGGGGRGERIAAAAPAAFFVKVKYTLSRTRLLPESCLAILPALANRSRYESGRSVPGSPRPLPRPHAGLPRGHGGWEGFNLSRPAGYPATFLIGTPHIVSPCFKPPSGSQCPEREGPS